MEESIDFDIILTALIRELQSDDYADYSRCRQIQTLKLFTAMLEKLVEAEKAQFQLN